MGGSKKGKSKDRKKVTPDLQAGYARSNRSSLAEKKAAASSLLGDKPQEQAKHHDKAKVKAKGSKKGKSKERKKVTPDLQAGHVRSNASSLAEKKAAASSLLGDKPQEQAKPHDKAKP